MDGKKQTGKPAGTEVFIETTRESRKTADVNAGNAGWGCRVAAYLNIIIYYNSAILSRLLNRYEVSGNTKTLTLITQMSPVAWQHILMNGHYIFHSDGKMIDLDAIITGLDFG